MATYHSEGIIIKSVNYKEADKILTLFTKRYGKKIILSKGARRLTSRKGPYLDLFNHNIFYLAEGKNFDILTDVKPIKTFSESKRTLEGISILYYIADILDKTTSEGQSSLPIFNLLHQTISTATDLSDLGNFSPVLKRYEICLLEKLGFLPELNRCVKCLTTISRENKNLSFSARGGGVVCNQCRIEGIPISIEAIIVLRFLLKQPIDKVKKLALTKSLGEEIKTILRYYIEWILEKKLKSTEFLEEVQGE